MSPRRSRSRRRRCSPRFCTRIPRDSVRSAKNCEASVCRCAMQLKPVIVQDSATGRVLMLAWMDEEAERLTRESGEAWFWSRSRERLWRKGETSGNTLAVVDLRDDCDGDALLLRAVPAGPTCHTGS